VETYLWEARRTPVLGGRPAASTIDDLEDAAAVYWRIRPSLITIAHRILGNATEAEDVLKEVWLRLHRTDRHAVHSHPRRCPGGTGRHGARQQCPGRRARGGTPVTAEDIEVRRIMLDALGYSSLEADGDGDRSAVPK